VSSTAVPAALRDIAEVTRIERMPVFRAKFTCGGRPIAGVLAVGRSPMKVVGGGK